MCSLSSCTLYSQSLCPLLHCSTDDKTRIQAVPVCVQSPVVPEPPTPPPGEKKAPKPLVRGKVIQEIIETEKEYHKDITMFQEHVVPFLQEVSMNTGAAMLYHCACRCLLMQGASYDCVVVGKEIGTFGCLILT